MVFANNTTGDACNLSIHDNTIHDVGVALLLENFSNSPKVQIYNNYIYNMDWALGLTPQTTTSAYTFLFHDNHIGSTTNWDTTGDSFHHDGIHNFGYTTLETLYEVYNNLFDGDWGSCCATAFIYTEYHALENYYQFNNVFHQHDNNLFPLVEVDPTTGGLYNDTYLCGQGSSTNVVALLLEGDTASTNIENNAFYGCNTVSYIWHDTFYDARNC